MHVAIHVSCNFAGELELFEYLHQKLQMLVVPKMHVTQKQGSPDMHHRPAPMLCQLCCSEPHVQL